MRKRGKFMMLDESIAKQEEYIEKIIEQHKKDLADAKKTLAELRERKKAQTKEQRGLELLAVLADKFGVQEENIDRNFIERLSLLPSEEVFEEDTPIEEKEAESSIDEELFKDADSQPANSEELKTIASYVGLPEDASLADVRKTFNARKNEMPPAIADGFEKVLGRIERGEN